MVSLFRADSGDNQSRIQPVNAYPGLGKIDSSSMTVVTGANIATDDTDTFTIDDGTHNSITFVFDHDNSVPYNTPYSVIDFVGDETVTELRNLVVTAINDSALQVFAEPESTDSIYVWPSGPSGPLELTESVASSSFTVVDGGIINVIAGTNLDGDAATVFAASAETYNLSDGMTLLVKVDGGAEQTATFETGDFVDISIATAAEAAAVITADITGAIGGDIFGTLGIISSSKGTSSRIEITGGTSNTVFQFTTFPVNGVGETFTIDNGTDNKVTFEYDDDDSVTETATYRKIPITTSYTADQVRDATITAIKLTPVINVDPKSGGSGQVLVFQEDAALGQITVTEAVSNPGFITTSASVDEYVYCLGTDILVPGLEDFNVGDKVSCEQEVTITSAMKLIQLQTQFRQPISMPIPVSLPSGSTISKRSLSATAASEQVPVDRTAENIEITTPSSFFTAAYTDREIYLAGAGIVTGIYKIFLSGYTFDDASGVEAYVADATKAVIYGLTATAGTTIAIDEGTLVGSFWRVNIYLIDGSTLIETLVGQYALGADGGQSRNMLLPDLSINVLKFTGDYKIKYELELAGTSYTAGAFAFLEFTDTAGPMYGIALT
jgi:hypothetical protein